MVFVYSIIYDFYGKVTVQSYLVAWRYRTALVLQGCGGGGTTAAPTPVTPDCTKDELLCCSFQAVLVF